MEKGLFLRQIKYLFVLFPLIAAGFSIWAALEYNADSPIWKSINSFINGRLALGQNGIQKYGIHLFGTPVKWIGNNQQVLLHGYTGTYNYVDNSYLQILLQYGIILFFLVLIAYAYVMYNSIKNEKYYLAWILFFIILDSSVELNSTLF